MWVSHRFGRIGGGVPSPINPVDKEVCMSKNQESKKETKKKPTKTLKEKRAEKKAKKEGRG